LSANRIWNEHGAWQGAGGGMGWWGDRVMAGGERGREGKREKAEGLGEGERGRQGERTENRERDGGGETESSLNSNAPSPITDYPLPLLPSVWLVSCCASKLHL
jgi:hypothetical protein